MTLLTRVARLLRDEASPFHPTRALLDSETVELGVWRHDP